MKRYPREREKNLYTTLGAIIRGGRLLFKEIQYIPVIERVLFLYPVSTVTRVWMTNTQESTIKIMKRIGGSFCRCFLIMRYSNVTMDNYYLYYYYWTTWILSHIKYERATRVFTSNYSSKTVVTKFLG